MQKILAVATNDATLINGKRTGLWLSELTHFLAEIEDAGLGWDVVSPRGGVIPLDENSVTRRQLADRANARFLGRPELRAALERSRSCAEVDVAEYAGIYLAGGHGTMFDFRHSEDLKLLITAFDRREAWLSGVCHGVAGFVDVVDRAGGRLIADKTVTGFSNLEDLLARSKRWMPFLLEDALRDGGATYRKGLLPFTERVEVDGRLITGQNPQSARGVGRALVSALSASGSALAA